MHANSLAINFVKATNTAECMMHMQIKDIAYFKKLYIYSETDGTYFESLTTKSLLKIVSAKNDLF